MNNIDLKKIIEQYPDCINNGSKLKGIILDLYPDTPKAIVNTLVIMVNSGMAKEIQDNENVTELDKSRWQKQLENEGFAKGLICSCLNIFFEVFGLKRCLNKQDNSNLFRRPKEKQLSSIKLANFEIKDGVLVKYKGTEHSIVLPQNIISIGPDAFNFSQVRWITIPENIKSIDFAAFKYSEIVRVQITDLTAWCKISGLDNLMLYGSISKYLFLNDKLITDLIIPDDVETIANYAFYGCTSITKVIIGYSVLNIGKRAFCGCDNLTSIVLPKNSISIYSFAFEYCNKLEDIYICDLISWCQSSGLGYLMNSGSPHKRLYLSNELLTRLIIPDGVIAINDYSFYNCNELTDVIIGNNVSVIGCYAFGGCNRLTNIKIPNSVTSIADSAFIHCGFKTISLSGIRTISTCAFAFCDDLTHVTLSEGLTDIASQAFYSCSKLKHVTIPESTATIGRKAFEGCPNLEFNEFDNGLYLGNDKNKFIWFIKTKSTDIDHCLIHKDCKHIYCFALYNCKNIKSIAIPSGITSIGQNAFSVCDGLTEINFAGTINEWKKIKKEKDSFRDTGVKTVACSDGITNV